MIWQVYDWLYMAGMVVVWVGNLKQVIKIWKTHSTRSFSLLWLVAMAVSFSLRMPRAMTSGYWVWSGSYIVSLLLMFLLVGVVLRYRKEGK